jgi:hypothetical protein
MLRNPFSPRLTLGALSILLGCTANRPILVAPEPVALGSYLAEERPPDLLVTDSGGHAFWLHAPELRGDTLTGRLSLDARPKRIAIPLAQVRDLRQPHFSAGRTFGLIGGVIGAAGITLLIVAVDGPQPVY